MAGKLLAPLARTLTASSPRVLFFHRLGEGSERLLPPSTFEAQLRYLKQHFNLMPLDALANAIAQGEPVPARSVALTFDDGYADFLELAYPLLCAYEIPATLFVVSRFAAGEMWLWFDQIRYVCEHSKEAHVEFASPGARWLLRLTSKHEREGVWDLLSTHCLRLAPAARDALISAFAKAASVSIPRVAPAQYRSLDFNELRSLDRAIVQVGAHTRTHPILSSCSVHQQQEEIAGAKMDLERELSHSVSLLAYPNGSRADFDAYSMRSAREAGFTAAFTSDAGLIEKSPDPWALPRIAATANMGFFCREVDGLSQLRAQLGC